MWHKMAADVAQDDRPAGRATKKIPYQYYLRQDKSSNPRKSGKYYAKRFNPTVLGTRGLAEHMIGHGLIAERSEVETITVDGKKKIILHRPSGEEEEG